jgi:AcrR family transcriptional regulator
MSGSRRATSEEQKALRAERVMESARAAWSERGYSRVSVQEVAERAGVAKGTVFLYYATKEALGLAVLGELLAEWTADLEARLSALERPGSPSTVAAAVRRSLEDREELLRLLGMVGSVLEANAGGDEVVAFRRRMMNGAVRLGAQIGRALPFLRPGEDLEVSLTLHAMLIGIHHIAAGRSGDSMPGDDLAPFRVGVPGAVGRTIRIQLEGARAMAALAPGP